MKTRYYLLGIALCSVTGLGLTSCDNDEFLDVIAYDVVDEAASYESRANAKKALNGVYDMVFPNDTYDGDWGFKPNLFTGCHPTIDTQATGWDKNWNVQAWNPNSSELLAGWKHVYAGICRANDFLEKLKEYPEDVVGADTKKYLEAEGRCLRGFFYHWLATTFGRVPMLATGENGANTPEKARAATYTEMWDFIIEDFTEANKLFGDKWTPMDNEYGRCTKGMALAYLGDAYMWKAYRMGEGSNGIAPHEGNTDNIEGCYQKARDCFKQILDSHTYKLNESFTTLWDPASAWGPETIWCEQLDEGNNWGKWDNLTSKLMLKWYTACPENGGWGSLYLSWEWYSCYEKGDKRRAGSCYTGAVPQINPDDPAYDPQYEGWIEPAVYGVNPYLQEVLGKGGAGTATKQFHFNNGEWAPAIWSSKMWRTASADYKSWGDGHWSPTPIYWKRLPNVMLDYAECCFRLGQPAEGWKQINELRNRAFGKLEDGKEAALTSKYLPYYNSFAEWVGRTEWTQEQINDSVAAGVSIATFAGGPFIKTRTEYPIPFGSNGAVVEDAETYYTRYAAAKGFTKPVWQVAVNTERRKEFNCEWCLRPDMQKSGFMAEHVAVNYPKRSVDDLKDVPWTNRDYDYNDLKMDMPIPEDEIIKNPLCDQNEAYRN